MTSLFEADAHFDNQRRQASRTAVVIAKQRADKMFGAFISSRSAETALDYLEGSVQGELKSAMSNSAMVIENGADAIKRLAGMDGYTVDNRRAGDNETTQEEQVPGASILRSL